MNGLPHCPREPKSASLLCADRMHSLNVSTAKALSEISCVRAVQAGLACTAEVLATYGCRYRAFCLVAITSGGRWFDVELYRQLRAAGDGGVLTGR